MTATAVERRSAWAGRLVDLGVVAVAAALIFAGLGKYPFWGDEADTVIFGRSAWETGDMGAWYDGNLYAYRNGAPLEHLKNRAAPPLPFYLVAPFWGFAGVSRFWLRVPFAICGVGSVALFQHAWKRLGFVPWQRLLLGGGLACNVSFVLYSRQCRYYALAALLSLVIAYLYATYDGSRTKRWGIVVAAVLLAATQFINFIGVMAALVVDYAFWKRRQYRLSLREWIALLVPITAGFAVLLYAYFPLGRALYPGEPSGYPWLIDRFILFARSLRDLNLCEYGVGIAFMAALPLGLLQGLRRGDWLLLRLLASGATFLFVSCLLSPQPIAVSSEADVRYYVPIIFVGVAVTMLVILELAGRNRYVVFLLAALCTFSNAVHRPIHPRQWTSNFANYVEELARPRRPASQVLAEWLRENVPAGKTVAFMPSEWLAPLIIDASHVFYGWQLLNPMRSDDYAGLDERLWTYRKPVDVIIVMGVGDYRWSVENTVLPSLRRQGMSYEPWTTLDVYFDDRTRPELFWHWFREESYDRETNAVYIYRRVFDTPSSGPSTTSGS